MWELVAHKIKTASEILALIGPRPRTRSAIMCHGVFDIVHPGHVRHLLYAKSKADILIASLTADRWIDKGVHRPHVPEHLRAMNLAAFEMIDFVIIDDARDALGLIALIQPDYFAKGFEYASVSHAATAEEASALAAYGGEMIFTPGDVVMSSTRVLNEYANPSLRFEKLRVVMERYGVTFDRLRSTLDGFGSCRIHVVGDTIVDSLTHTSLIGSSGKTPTLSVLHEARVDYVGGAAVVAKHARAAGASCCLTTVLGDDELSEFVVDELDREVIVHDVAIDSTRPTVSKNVIVCDGYRLLKIDTLDNRSIGDEILKKMTDSVALRRADAVIFSDFRHGVFNRRTIPAFIGAIPPGALRCADSQVASRWGNIVDFTEFDLIMPNEREARFALGDQDSPLRPLASALYDKARCRLLVLKLGERGAIACRSAKHEDIDSFFAIDSFASNCIDPVGAGDAMFAYASLAMLVGEDDAASDVIAVIIGSCASAVECEHEGNVAVSVDDVRARINAIERGMK